MIKVGITGQSGFIGSHLYNYLKIKQEEIILIPFEDSFFMNQSKLEDFVSQCDTIVHLAAVNRHSDPGALYDTNIWLVKTLVKACEKTGSKPHILFSSSIQEEKDNPYGNSKRNGRLLFEEWTSRNNASFTGLIIPNVFGPFGNPFYNSVIATFCYQLTHDEHPGIDIDGELRLIYISELLDVIYQKIKEQKKNFPQTQYENSSESETGTGVSETIYIQHTVTKKVSEILTLLLQFKSDYFEKGIFPELNDSFLRNLFNTFVSYIDHQKFFPFQLMLNTDERGNFVEIAKLSSGGQISFSTTRPGITRGNHYHTRKAERFAVIKGEASIELRRIGTDKVIKYHLDGKKPSFVDMPVWYTHNITNTGTEDLYTIFWISEIYDPLNPDTYFESVWV